MLRTLLDRLAPSAALRRPLAETRFVVFDAEMTGLDLAHDRIISLGAIRMQGAEIRLGETFSELVDPGRALEGSNVLIHRLTPDRLAGRRSIEEAGRALHEFCAGDVLVGHCVRLDLNFLRRALPAEIAPAAPRIVDTAAVARWLAQQRERFLNGPAVREGAGSNLFELARSLGIDVTHPHDALHDAYVTAQVWQRLIPQLAEFRIRRLLDLPAACCAS